MPVKAHFSCLHVLTICFLFGLFIDRTTGRQTLGSTCEVEEDCGIPFETCNSESATCVCRSEYEDVEGYCRPVSLVRLKRNAISYGTNCTVDGDCGTNEFCDSGGTGLCSCTERYWSSTGVPSVTGCDVYFTYGLNCSVNCTGPNEECINTVCSCINGYTSSLQSPNLNITGCDAFTFGSACTSDSNCMTGRETCDLSGDSTCICASGWARSGSETNCDTFYGVAMTVAGLNYTEFQAIESTFASAVANTTNDYCSTNITTVEECCNIQTTFVPSTVLQITNDSLISYNASYDTALKILLVLQTPDDNELCAAAAALPARRKKRFAAIGVGLGSLNPALSLALLTSPTGIATITTQVVQAIQATFGYTPTLTFTVAIVPVPTNAPVTSVVTGAPVTQPQVQPTVTYESPAYRNWVFILVVTLGTVLVLILLVVAIVSCVRSKRPTRSRISHSDSSSSMSSASSRYSSRHPSPIPRNIIVIEREPGGARHPSSSGSSIGSNISKILLTSTRLQSISDGGSQPSISLPAADC